MISFLLIFKSLISHKKSRDTTCSLIYFNTIDAKLSNRDGLIPYEPILKNRVKYFANIACKIKSIKNNIGPISLDDLLFSIQHMTMNRWFRSRNRNHELVIYSFLQKYYSSQMIRK